MYSQNLVYMTQVLILFLKTQSKELVHAFSKRLFGTSFHFVFELFGGVFLLLLISAVISHFFGLDKIYEGSDIK
jgi:hypothetical protein